MRYLEGKEIIEANKYIEEAIKEAEKSLCNKSKRGIIIVKNDIIIGRGFNNPPLDLLCEPEYCYPICNQYCIHAEENAIFDALMNNYDLNGSRMYHIKIKEGEVRTSGMPSCVNCSKKILHLGIAEFVLKHDVGYRVYSAREFHELSLESLSERK